MPTLLTDIAVIGGSGLYYLEDPNAPLQAVQTPYASEAVQVALEQTSAGPTWFLPRHGKDHNIAPHEINYRANLWALHALGARRIIAVNAVGGITKTMLPGTMVVPHQLIDYSWGREHTFFSGNHAFDKHIDFTQPYTQGMRQQLLKAANKTGIPVLDGACYASTQGPRLETAAEITRLARDGCDIVGMTGMPEAALARELELAYASLALVVNRAAGLEAGSTSLEEMRRVLDAGVVDMRCVLLAVLAG
jgi:5'-methylthioinosine phosphorylase